jgi:formate/nitrite transporter FocA (FNT family)
MTTTETHRHPVRGFFAGLMLGIGLAIMLVIYGVVPITAMWFTAFVVGGIVIGVGVACVTPARHKVTI